MKTTEPLDVALKRLNGERLTDPRCGPQCVIWASELRQQASTSQNCDAHQEVLDAYQFVREAQVSMRRPTSELDLARRKTMVRLLALVEKELDGES